MHALLILSILSEVKDNIVKVILKKENFSLNFTVLVQGHESNYQTKPICVKTNHNTKSKTNKKYYSLNKLCCE